MKTQIIEKIISDMSSNTERVNESWYFTLEQVQKYLEANLQPPKWVEELIMYTKEDIKNRISTWGIQETQINFDDIAEDIHKFIQERISIQPLHSIAPIKLQWVEELLEKYSDELQLLEERLNFHTTTKEKDMQISNYKTFIQDLHSLAPTKQEAEQECEHCWIKTGKCTCDEYEKIEDIKTRRKIE